MRCKRGDFAAYQLTPLSLSAGPPYRRNSDGAYKRYTDKVIPDDLIAFGEIGLSGEVRAISHVEYRVKEAVRLGFTKIVLPKKNINSNLKVPKNVELLGVSNIYQVLLHMRNKQSTDETTI